MFEPRVETVARPLQGFLRYVPETQAIRDAALAAFAPFPANAGWPLEADPQQEEGGIRTLPAASPSVSDDRPVAAAVHRPEGPVGAPAEPREAPMIERAAGAETSDSAEASPDLERSRSDVLAGARLLLVSDQQQQEARTAACRAEEAWVRTRYCPTATKEQLKAANRARLAARRGFARAWEEYLAASQVVCRSVETMVEQEASVGTV